MSKTIVTPLNLPRRMLGKKVVYQMNDGYFLVQGFEKHGLDIFAYGVVRGGHGYGLRPIIPRHVKKVYYQANYVHDSINSFSLYKKEK